MRFVYCDEAGTSSHEPVSVVAAVVVNPDREWRALEEHLKAVAEKYLPKEDQSEFVFHAKDIWHGSGYFDRKKWPDRVLRHNILLDVLQARWKIGFSVCIGFIFKDADPGDDDESVQRRHAGAYIFAALGVEQYMREFAAEDEVATFVYEDLPERRSMIRYHHQGFHENKILVPFAERLLPVRRIVDTIHFAEKSWSPLLQFADCCAFSFRRHLAGLSHSQSLIDAIRGPNTENVPDDAHTFGFKLLATHR